MPVTINRPFGVGDDQTFRFPLPPRFSGASAPEKEAILDELNLSTLELNVLYDASQNSRNVVTVRFEQEAVNAFELHLKGAAEPGKAIPLDQSTYLVNRDDLKNWTDELRSSVKVIGRIEDREAFDGQLPLQIAETLMLKDVTVRWDETTRKISSPAFNVHDLQPDEIQRVFEGEFDYDEKSKSYTRSGGGGLGVSIFGIGGDASGRYTKQDIERLLKQRGLESEITGRAIRPKSLNVAQVSLAKLKSQSSFSMDLSYAGGDAVEKITVDLAAPASLLSELNGEQERVLRDKIGCPVGTVVMWSGDANNVPPGWAVCDGKDNRPDLRDRFVVGADPEAPEKSGLQPLARGEADQHSHAVDLAPMVLKTDEAGEHTHSLTLTNDDKTWKPTGNRNLWSGQYGRSLSFGPFVQQNGGLRGPAQEFSSVVSNWTTDSAGKHSHSVTVDAPSTESTVSQDRGRPRWFALLFIIKTK